MLKYSNLQTYLQLSDYHNIPTVSGFMDHLFSKINQHIGHQGKCLILTLTKKSAEEISEFLISKGYKAFYLHSEIDTIDRWEIIQKLKKGEIDILVGINLLREGIDLPEVTFIAILDADQEGFLRSTTSLIQIIGRAARNTMSEVVLYADRFTGSILQALRETYRRRKLQIDYNTEHHINPEIAISNIKSLQVVKTNDNLNIFSHKPKKGTLKKIKRMTKREQEILEKELKIQLNEAIHKWEFEKAAIIRDQIKELNQEIIY